MFFSIWLLWLMLTPPALCRTRPVESSRYECGAHGKFEYCIDDNPGCVIGCHCHPGYYFDTETKICEPNIKLIQNIQRHYVGEPTRVYSLNIPTTDSIPTPTTINGLDEFGKDSDDLGEWLYNQFFKTIEAQVINNTSDKMPTRRSENLFRPGGGGQGKARADRKSNNSNNQRKLRKSWRKRGKKKKSNTNGLRRKLLRITEDDSLFDSDSDSDEKDSDSSDNTSSGSSSSEISKDRDIIKNGMDNREHGHKKVVIFNRRPRPPLPSFIILPNMEAPYYPPIGLPPPPILPMYPMVPIPPMAPFLPFLEKTSDNITTTSKPHSSSAAEYSTREFTTMQTELDGPVSDALRYKNDRFKIHKSYKLKRPLNENSSDTTFLVRSRDIDPDYPVNPMQEKRIKLVQHLKANLNKKHRTVPDSDTTIDEVEEDTPLLNHIPTMRDSPVYNLNHKSQKEREMKLKDFKYLSELIHKVDLSGSKPPTSKMDVKASLMEHLKRKPNARRQYNSQPLLYQQESTTHKPLNTQDPEGTYFMDLGRQIASLVRKTDSTPRNSDYMAKDENEHGNSILSILNENRYPSRSYWERFVRSPLTKLKKYFADLNNYNDNNNENNLLYLENLINIFTKTEPPTTLQELENMLNKLEKEQLEPDTYKNTLNQSNGTLDFRLLLDKPLQIGVFSKKNSIPYGNLQYVPQRRKFDDLDKVNAISEKVNKTYLQLSNLHSPIIGNWMFQNQKRTPMFNNNWKNFHLNSEIISKKYVEPNNNNLIYYSPSLSQPYSIDIKINSNMPNTYEEHSIPLNVISDIKHNEGNLEKYSELPGKYQAWASRYHDLATANLPNKYYELSGKDLKLPKKYSESPTYYQGVRAKLSGLRGSFYDSSPTYSDLPLKCDDIHTNSEGIIQKSPLPAKKYEVSTKYPEMFTKFIEVSAKLLDTTKEYHVDNMSTKLPEKFALEKSYEEPTKYGDMSGNITKHARRYLQGSKNYSADPVIFDYKRMNFVSNAPYKHRYLSYSVSKPNYRRTFPKEGDSPSYFHHELHHFDYFD